MDILERGITTAVALGCVDGADAATGAALGASTAAQSPQARSTLVLALITTLKPNAITR
jgi:hypothetical protein